MNPTLGRTFRSLGHGFGCACQVPGTQAVVRRVSGALRRGEPQLSRRAMLQGLGGTVAAAALARSGAARSAAPDQPILFTNVRIFDGRSATLLEGRNLLVSGQRIAGLPGAGESVADALAIDGGGRVIMPGLIDAHWHALLAAIPEMVALTADVPYIHLVAAREAERTLLRGFTTVRDVGGPAFALQKAIDEGLFPGPRIFPSGAMLSQTSGHGDFRFRNELPSSNLSPLSAAEAAGVSALADGVDAVLRRAREQLFMGASQIKIMAGGGVSSLHDPLDSLQYTDAEMQAAVAAAADWGTYVCAHVYTSKGIERALANGVRSIEHGQLADEEAVRRIVDAGAWWSLQPFLADEDANPKSDPEQREQQRLIAEGTVRAFELGQKYKAKMAWGTDILFSPGKTWTQNRQLTKMVRWFSPADLLCLATGRNGELLALSGERAPYRGALGVIEPGAFADLLLVDGNPLENLDLIAQPDSGLLLIMKDGRIYKDRLAG